MYYGRTSLLKILKKTDGIALFVAILVMAMIMLFIGGSLFLSRIDAKISNNYKLGTQSLEVADAGLLHALTLIANGYDFDSHLCDTPPCNLLSSTTFPPGSDFTYTVTLENDPADIDGDGTSTDDTNNVVVMLSTASGPNDTTREVQAYVNRSSVSFTPPGALYIPATTANFDFPTGAGNFTGFITGDDTTYTDSNSDGWAESTGAGTASSLTGAAPVNDTVRDSFKSAMGESRYNLVQGKDYDDSTNPLTPSVVTADVIDVNKIALKFYNNVAAENLHVDGLPASDCTSGSPCVFGTDASPQITYIREGADFINPNGYATGSGVIVFEGKVHLRNNFEFHGLVIGVREGLTGGTDPVSVNPDYFSLRNDSKIFGAVLLEPPTDSTLGFQMKNNSKIYYSKDAIDMAQNLCSSCLPQAPKIAYWFSK